MKTLQQLVKDVLIHRINKRKNINDIDNMREANFNAWKRDHDVKVKKCCCETQNPRPTDLNNCFDCNGEIYNDYYNKIRWHQK